MRRLLLGLAVGLGILAVTGPAQAQDFHRPYGYDRGHYHYTPGHFDRHRNHYHYTPGHYDYHRGPDYYPGYGGYPSAPGGYYDRGGYSSPGPGFYRGPASYPGRDHHRHWRWHR